jgi:hypothetical protein
MPPNTESLLPALLLAYAETRRSDLSLPASSVLPFVAGPTTADATYPRVNFVAADTQMLTARRMRLTVQVQLQVSDKHSLTQENTWAAGLRYILADRSAFMAYLNGLSEAHRTGWQMRFMRVSDSSFGMDGNATIRFRITDVAMDVMTDELAPD